MSPYDATLVAARVMMSLPKRAAADTEAEKGWVQVGAPGVDPRRRLKIGALVDLTWDSRAGGHVKCWERLAEAATRWPESLDLDVHFAGEAEQIHPIAENVRYVIHRPVFSTRRLPFLSYVPDHTDLAFYHRRLARDLPSYDVIHTTDAYFAFARTALKVAKRRSIPLVNSIHTDTPQCSRVFTARFIVRLAGHGVLGRLLLERLKIHERLEARMLRALERHQACCRFVLVSQAEAHARACSVVPEERVSFLRRGIDLDAFTPLKRDRGWLEHHFSVPPDRIAVLFVGRLDRSKNILTLADAVRQLVDRGLPLHLVCAGDGEDRAAIVERLGDHATCPGNVSVEPLTRLYASADVFASPSEIEVHSNVVMEAMAAGLPVLVAECGGMGRIVSEGESGVVVRGEGSGPWAEAIAWMVADRERLAGSGRSARAQAEREFPTWDDVLVEDLLPVWRRAALGQAGGGGGAA